MTVTVNRNMKSPAFTKTEYNAEIQDNEPLSSSIIDVKAADADAQVGVTYLSVVGLTGS